MIYGNYWDQDQVVVATVVDTDRIPSAVFTQRTGTPAFIVGVADKGGSYVKEYIFVEIIPGTEHEEHFLNLGTGQFEHGICAKINIYMGKTFRFEDMVLKATDSWPLAWFKLKTIPPLPFDTNAAYDRAMAIIGG